MTGKDDDSKTKSPASAGEGVHTKKNDPSEPLANNDGSDKVIGREDLAIKNPFDRRAMAADEIRRHEKKDIDRSPEKAARSKPAQVFRGEGGIMIVTPCKTRCKKGNPTHTPKVERVLKDGKSKVLEEPKSVPASA